MTKFQKDSFNYFGGYLTYGPERRFVARFKGRGCSMVEFRSFLMKYFTVEEYFALQDNEKVAPLTILQTKGFVTKFVKESAKLGSEVAIRMVAEAKAKFEGVRPV